MRLLHVPLAKRGFMRPDELPRKWRKLGQQQRQLGAKAQAAVLEYCAEALATSWDRFEAEELSVAEAARESGYSEEHLRRLVRDGRLTARRGARPKSHLRIRRSDLPRKPAKQPEKRDAVPSTDGYDPDEDARDIAQLLEADR